MLYLGNNVDVVVTCCEGQDELGGHVHGAAQEERDQAAGQGSHCCQQLGGRGVGVRVCKCSPGVRVYYSTVVHDTWSMIAFLGGTPDWMRMA